VQGQAERLSVNRYCRNILNHRGVAPVVLPTPQQAQRGRALEVESPVDQGTVFDLGTSAGLMPACFNSSPITTRPS